MCQIEVTVCVCTRVYMYVCASLCIWNAHPDWVRLLVEYEKFYVKLLWKDSHSFCLSLYFLGAPSFITPLSKNTQHCTMGLIGPSVPALDVPAHTGLRTEPPVWTVALWKQPSPLHKQSLPSELHAGQPSEAGWIEKAPVNWVTHYWQIQWVKNNFLFSWTCKYGSLRSPITSQLRGRRPVRAELAEGRVFKVHLLELASLTIKVKHYTPLNLQTSTAKIPIKNTASGRFVYSRNMLSLQLLFP